MMGTNEEEKQEDKQDTYEQLRWMAWNINGRGEKGASKIQRIRGEVGKYDAFILTETHVADADADRKEFDKHFDNFHVYHAHAKVDSGRRLGVAIGIKKNRISEGDIETQTETEGEGGRWIRMTLRGMMGRDDLHIWGIYPRQKRPRIERSGWVELGKR